MAAILDIGKGTRCDRRIGCCPMESIMTLHGISGIVEVSM